MVTSRPMSQQKEARNTRRVVAEKMKDLQPMKVVPSKKGLLTAFMVCAWLGWASGFIIHELVRK
jgi:hypothetical protein